jgi:hypothetical protein
LETEPLNVSREITFAHEKQLKTFEFDGCADAAVVRDASAVYDAFVAPFVVSFMDGKNVTLLAYGQTGSGKTHFMQGGNGQPTGVYASAVRQALGAGKTCEFLLEIVEVYNDGVRDLLCESVPEETTVRQDAQGQVFVPGLTQARVASEEDARVQIERACKRRATAGHAANRASSRSHLIFTLRARFRESTSVLTLVDLAGSERQSKTQATGDRLNESKHINTSLLALGDVIHALGRKQTSRLPTSPSSSHVPFRNSTLTFYLSDRMSKVAFFACVGPDAEDANETFSTLNFADRTRKIELGG